MKPREGLEKKERYNIILDPILHKEMVQYCLDRGAKAGRSYSVSRLISEAVNEFMYRNRN